MKEILDQKISDISKTIFTYCRSKTSKIEDAEDLCQEILLRLVRNIDSLRDENAFYSFMWSVAHNVYREWYRNKQKGNVEELSEENTPSYETETEEEDEGIYLLRRELALLSEKYRKTAIMYYINEMSCQEIAEYLDISESMVKYLLFKSRKMLKEGMNMKRNLGKLSYNPKTLSPFYHGQGPNKFWEFMQSKIKQNIVSACYNDSLTVQQISLETGIPLPYLDDEIQALIDKKIIIKDGKHYKSNIIIITTECSDEIGRTMVKYHKLISDKFEDFINTKMDEYKSVGFYGCDFSENTLRWQLVALLFRAICSLKFDIPEAPETGWGEKAYCWCAEELKQEYLFNYCGVTGKQGDSLLFFDYIKDGKNKGDHHDFYGNDRYINIFLDICNGKCIDFSEYDLEAIAEMIKKGYVLKDNGSYRVSTLVYTAKQYEKIQGLVNEFVVTELLETIKEMDESAARIISMHTPKYLQSQVKGIAYTDKFINAVCIPVTKLIDRHFLSTNWHPLEMPTTYVVQR